MQVYTVFTFMPHDQYPASSHREVPPEIRKQMLVARRRVDSIFTQWNRYSNSTGKEQIDARQQAIALTDILREELTELQKHFDTTSNPNDNVVLSLIQQTIEDSEDIINGLGVI
jgi:hypothetical protein